MGKDKNQTRKKRSRLIRPVTDVRRPGKKKTRSAEVISKLHNLNKQIDRILKDSNLSQTERARKKSALEEEIQALGGVEFYQHLSKNAEQRHGNFNSAKWVVAVLTEQGVLASHSQERTLSLLDVGALDLNYRSHQKSIKCTAIDLNPQKADIKQADFLTFQETETCIYDVIVLSLVINFVGDISKRGQMLSCAYRLCKPSGHVVVVLPLACLNNSRYMTHSHFEDMMTSLGFDLVTSHNSQKLSFKMFIKNNRTQENKKYPKKPLKNGPKMNNFCITLI